MANAYGCFAAAAAFAGATLLAAAASPQRALAHSDGHESQGHPRTFAAGEPGAPGGSGQPVRVVEIDMLEGDGSMSYTPSRIEVRKGELVKFVLKNAGALRHELLIDTFEGNARHKAEMARSPDMEHAEANGRHVDPRQSAELLWRFTQAGTFEYACLIPGHYEAGMKGVIIVR
jgi:uncharacterized cupredoxin-like copper-binding protein